MRNTIKGFTEVQVYNVSETVGLGILIDQQEGSKELLETGATRNKTKLIK